MLPLVSNGLLTTWLLAKYKDGNQQLKSLSFLIASLVDFSLLAFLQRLLRDLLLF